MDYLFQYKAVDTNGRIIESTVEAKSEDEAVKLLRTRDLNIINLKQMEIKSKDIGEISLFAEKVKTPDIMVFCRQLSTMLNAGLPLDRGLGILVEQTTNKILKSATANVLNQIKQGVPFSKGMRSFPNVFPELLVNMVESGELTGKLDEVLGRMAIHYQKENRINSKVKGALIYPAVLACITIVAVIIMLVFVMPMFTSVFEQGGTELPLPTRILLGFSDSLIAYWWAYISVIAILIISIHMYGKTDDGKRVFAAMNFRIPIAKGSIKMIVTARFTRTLSTLLASGVPIVRSLESAAETTSNILIVDDMKVVIEGIKKGISLASLLRKISAFPPMMVSMISVGEETGDLDGMLEKTADFYDEELEAAMSRLVSLLEPVMILIMGGTIGFIVIAMLLPMFDLVGAVQNANS